MIYLHALGWGILAIGALFIFLSMRHMKLFEYTWWDRYGGVIMWMFGWTFIFIGLIVFFIKL